MEKTINRDSKQKLYVQVYSILEEKIKKGDWPLGTQIPTEEELCRTYNVSKVTVREAISELVREGYLRRQQGKGTFVTNSTANQGFLMKTRLLRDLNEEVVKGKREIIKSGIEEIPEDIKRYFRSEDEIYHILYKTVINTDSLFVEELFIPLFVLPDLIQTGIVNNSFCVFVEEKSSTKIVKVMQTIRVTTPERYLADILEMKEGPPALIIQNIFLSSGETPIAYIRLIGNAREYQFQTEFERTE